MCQQRAPTKRSPTRSSEVAKQCSPRRKPWEHDADEENSSGGAKECSPRRQPWVSRTPEDNQPRRGERIQSSHLKLTYIVRAVRRGRRNRYAKVGPRESLTDVVRGLTREVIAKCLLHSSHPSDINNSPRADVWQ